MTKSSFVLSDHVSKEDYLYFSDAKHILHDIIRNSETPLTIGVFGPWGSGKTSLMKQMHDEILGVGLRYIRPVWITAWKYDKYDALWRVFLLRVIDALYPREEPVEPGVTGKRIPVEELSNETQIELVKELERLEETVYRPLDWE